MDGTTKHLAARYDAAAKHWQGKIAPLGYPAAYAELVQHLGKLDSNSPDVLDAGAGCADFTSAYIAKFGAPNRLTLLDISSHMLGAAKQRLGVNANYVTGTIESLEPHKVYDVILCAHVVEHCPDPAAALTALRRALRPNGVLLLVASKPHWCTALIRIIWRNKAFRPAKMQAILWSAGFSQVATHGFSNGPPSRTSMGYIATL